MPSHDKMTTAELRQLLQSGGGGAAQQPTTPVALPGRTAAKYPGINALKRLLPGVSSRGQKAKKQYDKLKAQLEGSTDATVQRQVGIADALRGTNAVQARDVLLQAAQPREASPLPPGLQELMFRANATPEQLKNLTQFEHGPDTPSDPIEMFNRLSAVADPEERNTLVDLYQRIKGGATKYDNPDATARIAQDEAAAEATNRAPTTAESQIGFVNENFPEGERAAGLRSTFGSSQSLPDLYANNPKAAAQQHRDALARVPNSATPQDAFSDVLEKGAAKQVLDAQVSLNTDYVDVVEGNIEHLNSVLDDPQFNSHFGSYAWTNVGRSVGSESERDFQAKLLKVSGGQMLKAIESFSGAISDKDLEIAAQEATSLFTKSSVSPELAKAALTKLRDAYSDSLSKRKALSKVDSMDAYRSLTARNTAPSEAPATYGLPDGWGAN